MSQRSVSNTIDVTISSLDSIAKIVDWTCLGLPCISVYILSIRVYILCIFCVYYVYILSQSSAGGKEGTQAQGERDICHFFAVCLDNYQALILFFYHCTPNKPDIYEQFGHIFVVINNSSSAAWLISTMTTAWYCFCLLVSHIKILSSKDNQLDLASNIFVFLPGRSSQHLMMFLAGFDHNKFRKICRFKDFIKFATRVFSFYWMTKHICKNISSSLSQSTSHKDFLISRRQLPSDKVTEGRGVLHTLPVSPS